MDSTASNRETVRKSYTGVRIASFRAGNLKERCCISKLWLRESACLEHAAKGRNADSANSRRATIADLVTGRGPGGNRSNGALGHRSGTEPPDRRDERRRPWPAKRCNRTETGKP